MLTAKELKRILHYNPKTGIWTRIFSNGRSDLVGSICKCVDGYGYVQIRIGKQRLKAHRLAFLYMIGKFPKQEVDHIDLNRANNKWSNLREATKRQNMMNMKVRRDNVVGLKGVTRTKDGFMVRIVVDGKRKYIGLFGNQFDAHRAYLKEAKKHFGLFARGG